ncbi:hypothetical protein Silverhawkium_gp117 [Shigella phage Silverhawkium]|uniref:Uncharacterized protein n=2 Tax=Mooglevirus TaxID=1985303 RepID=A0A482JKC7_9CAUD|nr:hypothetical protein CHB7_gp119 [Enterobacteria phage CHB7]QBP33203.1 hypothetical protein Silverhawkium_gp117 [Shigella phage Silverhawkium]
MANNKEVAILKARLTVNRINAITSTAPDETLHNIIGKIQGVILDVENIKNSLANVANGSTLDGAQYEMADMLAKSKVMNKELDLKMFRFAVKVWLSIEFDANFAIADFFATWLQRNLTKQDFQDICDVIYAEL